MSNIQYVKSGNSVSFRVDGKLTIIPQSHINYDNIMLALADGDMDAVLPLLVEPRQYIANVSKGTITHVNGELLFEGEPIRLSIVTRIIALIRDGFDVTPLLHFTRNLLDNPSQRAREELYGFLEVNDLPITADGHFIAYKMIRDDYTDIYTGSMDNSIGAIVRMDRDAVDPDKNRTCSKGLHFCSREYVGSGYGSRDGGHRIVAVKINPRDVVAIPTDYNNSKGRACEYLILRELDWSEKLPVGHTGFKLLRDDEEPEEAEAPLVDEADDEETALVLMPSGAAKPRVGQSKWSDDDILKVKKLLADPDMTLVRISKETGMSRRNIARIRDGQAGTHVVL